MKQKTGKVLILIIFSICILGILTVTIANWLRSSAYESYNSRLRNFEYQISDVATAYKTFGVSDETRNLIEIFFNNIPEGARENNNIVIVDQTGAIIYRVNERFLWKNQDKMNIAWNINNVVMQDEKSGKNVWMYLNYLCGQWSFENEKEYCKLGDLKFASDIGDVLRACDYIQRDVTAVASVYPVEMKNGIDYVFWFRDNATDTMLYDKYRGNEFAIYDFALLCGVIMILLYWLLLPVWVFLDARRRQTQPLPWALLVLLTNVVGLIVYWIVQSQNGKTQPASACPACGKAVKKGYPYCPWCAVPLVKACKQCGKPLEPGWTACPWCGNRID